MKHLAPLLALAVIAGTSCQQIDKQKTEQPQPPSQQPPKAAQQPQDYEQQIMQWRQRRVERLKAPDGWLSLIGLHWLVPGANSIGSDPSNTIHLKAKVPAKLGELDLRGNAVTLKPNASAGLTIDGKPVTDAVTLIPDIDPKGPTVVQVGTVRFQVISRSGKLGVRVKDSESETRTHFLGIDYYPIDPKWRLEARFEPYNPPRKISITNILGMIEEYPSPGLLAFTVDGKEYKIEPVIEEGEKDWFIIFKDQTSGKETYGAARFVYATPPDASGRTVVDFNKAYNPPCAFTPYATCPLPPPPNRLPFRVTAGEKKYAGESE